MNKTKKIALMTSLGVIGVASLVPALSFTSTSCSSNGTFDTTNFSISKYKKYIESDEQGLRYLIIPNGTTNVNINLNIHGSDNVTETPFHSIVIPDSVTKININLSVAGDSEIISWMFHNFYYGNSLANKKIHSNSNQIEQFVMHTSNIVFADQVINFPTNLKQSTESKFEFATDYAEFESEAKMDFSNYTEVRDFSLVINKNSTYASRPKFSSDNFEDYKAGYIYFPKTIYSDSKFYVNFSGSSINANIVLPENLESINQDMFGNNDEKSQTNLAGSLRIPATVREIPNNLLTYTSGYYYPFTLTFESPYLLQKYLDVLKTENSFLPFDGKYGEILTFYPWTLDLSPIDKSYWDSNISFKKGILAYLVNNYSFSRWFSPNGPNGGQGEKLWSSDAQKMLEELNDNTNNNYA